jgi:hypothetical protein
VAGALVLVYVAGAAGSRPRRQRVGICLAHANAFVWEKTRFLVVGALVLIYVADIRREQAT